MYNRLELIKPSIDLRQDAVKNLRLAQRRYKRDYDQLVRLESILLVGDYIFLDRPALFHSAAEGSAHEVYSKLLRRKQITFEVMGITDNTLQILQNGLENTIFIHQDTLSAPSRRHRDDDPAYRNEHFDEEKAHSAVETDGH